MSKVYVVAALAIVVVVLLEAVSSVVVFVERAGRGELGERALPDDGAGLAHQVLGLYVLPVVVTALVISSFDTRYQGATRWAVGIGLVFLVDVALASFGILYGTVFAAAHAVGGLVLAVLSLHAVRRLRTAPRDEPWDLDDWR